GDEDAATRTGAAQDLQQDHQRAGAARAVDGADARLVDDATECQVDDGGGELLVADHALVGLGPGAIEDALLGLLHRGHYRGVVAGVFVDAHAKIDLTGAG